jgi:hypothetical protein
VDTVVVEEDTGRGVDVGVGVLGLAVLGEDASGNLGGSGNELEDGVVSDLLSRVGKVHQSLESRVRLSQNGVAVTGDDSARLEDRPQVLDEVLVGVALGDVLLHVEDESQDLLGGEAVERTSKTLETSRVGQVRIGQSGSNQVGGVSRDVSSLVVTVESKVESQEINEAGLIALAHHSGVVVRPVSVEINLAGERSSTKVRVLVDLGGNLGQLGNEVDGVIEGVLPVLGLGDTSLVGLGELGVVVKGRHGHGELGHGVQGRGQVVEHLVDKLGDLALLSELSRQASDLLLSGNLAGEEEPQHGLGEHLAALNGLGEHLLALLDGLAVESDTLISVKNGALPEHALEASHASEQVLDLAITERLLGVLGLDLLEELQLGGDGLLEGALEVRSKSLLDHGGHGGSGNTGGSKRDHCVDVCGVSYEDSRPCSERAGSLPYIKLARGNQTQ